MRLLPTLAQHRMPTEFPAVVLGEFFLSLHVSESCLVFYPSESLGGGQLKLYEFRPQ